MKELVYPRLLLPSVERLADKVAFHDGGYEATFAQHLDRVLRLGDGMRRELGLGKGDRFAVMALNSHEYLELYHAGFMGAGVINPLNLRLAGGELQHIIRDSGTTIVFVDAFFANHFAFNIGDLRGDLRIVLVGEGGDDLSYDLRYEDLIAAGDPVAPPEPDEADPAVLMYTGGTTGLPKGVLLDQRAEMLNVYHVGLSLGYGEHRVYLHQTPMFHAASMAGVLGIPATGGRSVFIGMFDPGRVVDLVEDHGVDETVMVPTMIAMMLDAEGFEPHRLDSLDVLVYGASPMPQALLGRVLEQLPWVNLWQGYGMTEASSVITLLSADDHRRDGPVLRSAGRPMPGVVISIQDPDGNVLAPFEEGEVCARAGNFMTEYWHDPEATADAFRDGWYHTGDAGHVDREGYVYLVDRVKDMIVTGGENVYSIEVENAISTHPAVDQVAVIGIPHEVWGEQVHAIVVLRAGITVSPDEIRAWARRVIAGFKVPKSVEFRDEPLPLSGALKPLKRELRKPYWEGQDRSVS